MKKKRFIGIIPFIVIYIAIILMFMYLTSLEVGIFLEVMQHGWWNEAGIGEYTKIGNIGTSFLILSIPTSIQVLFFIRLTSCIKESNLKKLFFDCICALFGIGLGIKIIFIVPSDPILELGRQIAAFFIDNLNWMTYPIP